MKGSYVSSLGGIALGLLALIDDLVVRRDPALMARSLPYEFVVKLLAGAAIIGGGISSYRAWRRELARRKWIA